MTRKRLLIHTAFLFLLPLVVAWFGLGVTTAALLVLLMLLWRWAIVLSGIVSPEKVPDVALETISASHYVEKVRWCMDRLGIDYVERQHGGTLGAYFTGRSVPQLRVRTDLVQSVIGNSPEILRFLYGNYAATHDVAFLEPTQERIELERRLDRYARYLQVWLYYHSKDDPAMTIHLWGGNDPKVPAWQRRALHILHPLLIRLIVRSFRVNDASYAKAMHHFDELLTDIDTRLSDGRRSILGGDQLNYTDITFASFCGLWAQTENYGGGMADDCRIEREDMPAGMRADIERWIEDHPKANAFVNAMYDSERIA